MPTQKQVTINVKKGENALVRRFAVTEGEFVTSNPNLSIDTNFDVQAIAAFSIVSGGKFFTVAAAADFNTGTAKVIAIDQWAAALLSVDADGTPFLQWAADGSTEARAIDALDALTPTGAVVVGFVSVQTKAGVDWTAGTDALKTGTGGDVALSTNFTAVFGWLK